MGSISNCGKDENGAYSGGQAGDQTGQEYHLVNWYSRPWSAIYRHPNANVRATISRLAADAANNNKIGYDQSQRGTFWNELQKVGYEPSKITTACEADCSSSTSAIIMAAGHLCNVGNLQNIGLPTAADLLGSLSSYGFTKYTGSDYLSSSAKLVAGDIMVMPNHAAIWCDSNASDGGTGGSGDSSGGGSAGGSGQLGSLGIGSYQYQDYTVKSGDTIYSIAKKFNCTPAMILFINGLDSAELTPGATLKVPVSSRVLSDASSGTEPITRKHTSGILVHHPVIEALFFTEQGLLATVSTTGLTSATDFDNDIISVNTVRDMAQDCPTFTITLVWRRGWYTALSSNDLVIIKMQRPPETKSTVFFGLIDDIRKVVDFSSGQPQRAVQVTGRGFNKALTTFDVGLLENISIDIGTGFFAGLTELVSMDSYDTIRTVLENYVGRAIKYKFANGKKFEDYFQYDGNRHEGEILTDYENYTDYNGSLWNFIKELTNTPFNETYWEIQDEKPTCIHRRTPFNKEDWINLPRQTIKDLDIVSDNTGRSDLETYTLYTVNPVLGSETLVNYFMPLWYPPFVWKYGITQLTATTAYQSWGSQSYGSGGVGATGEYDANVNIRRNIMFSGNGKNSLQYIVLHTSCGPGATAQGIADAVKNQGLSVHGVIDDEGVLQTAEWDVKCAHCGNGNSVSIGLEQTEHKAIHWNSNATTATWSDSDNAAIKAYHDKLYANAVALFAYLGKKYNIPSSNMISHKEIAQKFGGSDHADPEELWDLFRSRFGDSKWTMDAFRANVKKAMDSMVNASGSGWKTTNATSYGNTAGDDNGINGWNGYAYHTKSGCMVAIPMYCIKGSSTYNASYVNSDCPEFAQGYGTIVQIVNPANNKSCNAIVADCGSFGPHGSCNRDTLLDLQPNTQRALGFNGGTHQVKYRVIGHWDTDKTNGNGPYNP